MKRGSPGNKFKVSPLGSDLEDRFNLMLFFEFLRGFGLIFESDGSESEVGSQGRRPENRMLEFSELNLFQIQN